MDKVLLEQRWFLVTDEAGEDEYIRHELVIPNATKSGAEYVRNVERIEPDMKHVSTSYVERSNLSMRMSMRRFTRLTNAHSKKVENHCHALAIYFVWYNWARINTAVRVSPAMAAGLSDKLLDWADLVRMIDAYEPQENSN